MNISTDALSVVIIAKNEQDSIEQSIQSVIKATSLMNPVEILLVDSYSSDNTVNIASKFPINIIQLRPDWRHTPAAGRYMGFLNTNGEYIFFLDGDSFLAEGFLEKAIEYFRNDNLIGAIIGRRKEVYYEDGHCVGQEFDINNIGDTAKTITVAQASAIYRRSALQKVGPFNPYLYSEEEAELSERLRNGGYKLVGIPFEMVLHSALPRERIGTLLERMKSNFHLGAGQILRYATRNGISTDLFNRVSSGIRFLAWWLVGICCLLGAVALKECWFLSLWLLSSIFLFVLFCLKSGNIAKPMKYMVIWSLQSYSLVRGFLLRPMAPSSYPTDVIVIKQNRLI